MRRTSKLTVFLFLATGAFTTYSAYLFAASCSGNTQAAGNCTTGRDCDIATNPTCATQIGVLQVTKCVKGLPADNCVTTQTQELCAVRTKCEKNAAGTACVSGAFLGNANSNVVTDGGDCTIPG